MPGSGKLPGALRGVITNQRGIPQKTAFEFRKTLARLFPCAAFESYMASICSPRSFRINRCLMLVWEQGGAYKRT